MNRFAKKVFDGGGNDLKNHYKSYRYLSKFFKNPKYFANKFSKFLTPQREEELSRGSILIEFAICMPILIVLLFYIHDLMKIKQYYSQTEFVAQQMANILQNISQKRTNKKLTKKDIAYALCLAWQSMYSGTTMFMTNNDYPLGHAPYMNLYYVKGVDDGKATCVFRIIASGVGVTKPQDIITKSKISVTKSGHVGRVRFLSNTAPSNIYPTLKINKGEEKIIVEAALYRNTTWNPSTEKAALGLYLVNPPRMASGSNWRYMFYSVVIFTPKKGLFVGEDGPQ